MLEKQVEDLTERVEKLESLILQDQKDRPSLSSGVTQAFPTDVRSSPEGVPSQNSEDMANDDPEGSENNPYSDQEKSAGDEAEKDLNEKTQYEEIQSSFLTGDDKKAMELFEDFKGRFPKSIYIPEIYYWQGEWALSKKDHGFAVGSFIQGYKSFLPQIQKKSSKDAAFVKAIECLLKAAEALKALGKKEKADVLLRKVKKDEKHLPLALKRLFRDLQASL